LRRKVLAALEHIVQKVPENMSPAVRGQAEAYLGGREEESQKE